VIRGADGDSGPLLGALRLAGLLLILVQPLGLTLVLIGDFDPDFKSVGAMEFPGGNSFYLEGTCDVGAHQKALLVQSLTGWLGRIGAAGVADGVELPFFSYIHRFGYKRYGQCFPLNNQISNSK